MSFRATRAGLRAARRNGRLVAALWLVNLALAATAALPLWRALAEVIGPLPGADALAEAFSFGVLADLGELRPGLVAGFANAAAALYLLGLLAGLAVAGGALEVLTSTDERPFAHRFGRGLRFFGRFLRLGLVTLVAAVLLAALTVGPLVALNGRVRAESGSEWLSLAVVAAALLVLGLVLLLALLVQDAARIRIVREDARRVLPALAAGVRLVLRRPALWLSTWALNALVLLAAFASYLALSGTVAIGSRVALLVLVQQGFVLSRCALRVALLGAELELVPPPPAREVASAAEAPALEAQGGGVEPPPEPA
jgi:hypothetical protein